MHSFFSGNSGKSDELDSPQEGMQSTSKISGGHLRRLGFSKGLLL